MHHQVVCHVNGPKAVKLKSPVNIDQKHNKIFDKIEYLTRDQGIYYLNNINVTDRGIVFSGLRKFDKAIINDNVHKKYSLTYLVKVMLSYKRNRFKDDKNYLLVFDPWAAVNYYHWVIDTLPRLLIIKNYLADSVLLLPRNAKKYMYESVSYFEPGETYEFSKHSYAAIPNLFIASPLVDSFLHDGEALLLLRKYIIDRINEKILKLPEAEYNNKIYISRNNQQYRKIVNENEVCQVLNGYGFKIVSFEGMSFDEQVSLMMNAKYVVSSHGANLTNILFMPRGGKVLEFNRDTSPVLCFWSLASSIDLDYYYQLCPIFGSRNPSDNNADLYVNIEELQANIENMMSS